MKVRTALNWLGRPRNLWVVVFTWTILAGLLVQLILLPYVFPSWHAGNGLLKGVDGNTFHRAAVHLMRRIQSTGWSAWEPYPEGQFVAGIAAIFYALVYPAPWTVLPLNAVLNASACTALYLIMRQLTHDPLGGLAAASPFILFPSNLLWNTQLHNENYAVPGVIFILIGWMVAVSTQPGSRPVSRRQAILALLWVALGSLLLGLVRLEVFQGMTVLFLAGAFAMALAWLWARPLAREYLPRLALWGAALGVMLLIGNILYEPDLPNENPPVTHRPYESASTGNPQATGLKSDWKLKWQRTAWLPSVIDENLKKIATSRWQLARAASDGSSDIDSAVVLDSAPAVLSYLPRALQVAFLAPFPNFWFSRSVKDAGTGMRAVAGIEMVFVYAALLGLPIAVWKNRRQPWVWLILFVCVGMLVTYAVTVTNVGALYRFRYPYLMPLVGFGVAGWLSLTRPGISELQTAEMP